MKKSLKLWQICGFIFTSITGTLLHFLYDWTSQSIIVAPFSATNESTWEHMKLLFFPMFVFSLIEYRAKGESYDNFRCAKLAGTLTGLVLIPILFYTYTGITGMSADWFNIAIFFISAAAAYYIEYRLMKSKTFSCNSPSTAFIILCVIALLFVIFTFIQPKIPLFRDPTTGLYGI